jgi:hypothetical protein
MNQDDSVPPPHRRRKRRPDLTLDLTSIANEYSIFSLLVRVISRLHIANTPRPVSRASSILSACIASALTPVRTWPHQTAREYVLLQGQTIVEVGYDCDNTSDEHASDLTPLAQPNTVGLAGDGQKQPLWTAKKIRRCVCLPIAFVLGSKLLLDSVVSASLGAGGTLLE